MTDKRIESIVIVGGGSAGWMTAAALSNSLRQGCKITLIESDDIGTVGVGEATIPPIRTFNEMLGIDEREFVKSTQGSFKLGIEFVDWGHLGNRYFHPFGPHGRAFDIVGLHHYWLKAREAGETAAFDEHCMAWALARAGRFTRPGQDPRNVLSTFDYAYHFDAGLYARYLRRYSEERGVVRVEGKIASVAQNGESGFVETVQLEDGQVFAADLFIDCSGFRGLLIEGSLQTGYEDWSHWLPCDRAVAMQCATDQATVPYTRARALEAGWQFRIPLQHRVGNGYVYCSDHISDDAAADTLLANLDGKALADPRPLRFVTGRRRKFWNRNVVALGLASGFLEPLESTSIHLVQSGIAKLLAMFPDRSFDPVEIDRYNRVVGEEYIRIRDFIVLHYNTTTRDDSEFWNRVRTMEIPDGLREKYDIFRNRGRIFRENDELFSDTSWFSVMTGQNLWPKTYDPVADVLDDAETLKRLQNVRDVIGTCLGQMPFHNTYLSDPVRAA